MWLGSHVIKTYVFVFWYKSIAFNGLESLCLLDSMVGHQQKRKVSSSHATAAPHSADHSPLWELLMTRHAWGSLAATDLQEIAQAAVASGACHADIFALASLGAHGEQPGNCHRDLVRLYFSSLTTPELFSLAIPLCQGQCC